MRTFLIAVICFSTSLVLAQDRNRINDSIPVPGRWSIEKVNNWYNNLPWLVGANYYPATAINQIEMWQESTWDPERIDLELSWAADIGMNTLRVYLHDLVWAEDPEGLYQRMDEFLAISEKHGIRPWFVFFDDCHYPNPKLGPQPLPIRAFHNSGWVNSPAREVALRYFNGTSPKDEVTRLKGYVQQTMTRFKDDKRVLMWELYNEPGRGQAIDGDFESGYVDGGIHDKSKYLVYDSWIWAREVNPSQPITSSTAGSLGKTNITLNTINSDVYSIHLYDNPKKFRSDIEYYKSLGRPVFVSEWLARDRGNTVQDCLPIMKELNVAAVNWGFVAGKTTTFWNWDSRKNKHGIQRSPLQEREQGNVIKPGQHYPEPGIWFHDLLRQDGTPYNKEEIALFKKLTETK